MLNEILVVYMKNYSNKLNVCMLVFACSEYSMYYVSVITRIDYCSVYKFLMNFNCFTHVLNALKTLLCEKVNLNVDLNLL